MRWMAPPDAHAPTPWARGRCLLPLVLRAIVLGVLALASLSLASARDARAHEKVPGVLAMKEVTPRHFLARWTPPFPAPPRLTIEFAGDCLVGGATSLQLQADGPQIFSVDCNSTPAPVELIFMGESAEVGRVAVNVRRLDQRETFHLSDGTPPRVVLEGPASHTDGFDVVTEYIVLGVEHIWFGVDHLLFLLGLLLLLRSWKSLALTVTAFTVAHSVTLAAAALGMLRIPTAPVEICIALSVLLLAVEAAHPQRTATKRWPWAVALGFGLLHGLGFASALAQVGLPQGAIALALFAFNVGVEIGQICVVAFVCTSYILLQKYPVRQVLLQKAAIYGLGVCSSFWLFQRIFDWLVELRVLG